MPGTGSDNVFIGIGRAEVDVLHLLYRNAALHRHIGRRTDSGSSITGGRLYEQLLDLLAGDDLLVEFDVERATAGKGDFAGLADDVTG